AEIRFELQGSAELRLRRLRSNQGMTREEIRSLVDQLKGIVRILAKADPKDRRAVYEELNLQMTYHTDGKVEVAAGPHACTNERVGGETRTINPRGTPAGEFPLAA
ncbi:MAG: hypothetical protein ACE5FA_09180, partial [Dehalococcoidia bacterium]